VVDAEGRVLGVVSVKSLRAENLGFATPVDALRRLLESPNPVPYGKWLTIGALDPARWRPLMGGDWRQRAGRIHVSEPGDGFGGRAVCLWQAPPEGEPYEVAVDVELESESGAAGLVFAADGGDLHYGFYPSAGQLRLTYFGGPSVYDWEVLAQVEVPAYRPGRSNRLRVRVTPESIAGFVNGELVVESQDARLRGGLVGLAKFRDTDATFRRFRTGADLGEGTSGPGATDLSALRAAIAASPAGPGSIGAGGDHASLPLPPDDAEAARVLLEAADGLDLAAARAREMAADLRAARANAAVQAALAEDPPDLAEAALHIAAFDSDEIDIDAYLAELDRLGAEARTAVEGADDSVAALGQFLFYDNGFHGSRNEYGNASNSYLNEVIDDREGLPITLSVLYLEVARRAGVHHLVGLGLPGHFIVARQNTDSTTAGQEPYARYIDVFDRGAEIGRAGADAIVAASGHPSDGAASFRPAAPREIVTRMLVNLREGALGTEDWSRARRYAEAIVALNPEDPSARLSLAVLRWQAGRRDAAAEDFRWLLDRAPPGIDLGRIREFLERSGALPAGEPATPGDDPRLGRRPQAGADDRP
jgi:regulator of sirC expression with transglutaminase-like and TPR domain